MNAVKISDDGMILKLISGSRLYGTSTPTSDTDFVGIFIGNDDIYFGLNNVKEVDNSIKSKNADGKNTSKAVDDKLYELRNYARLAVNNNPNILEMLFANKENIIHINDYGQMLLDNAHLFPYQGAYDSYMGYAISQKHKMIIKERHFTELMTALEYFQTQELHAYLVEYRDKNLSFMLENEKHFNIGDLSFQKHLQIRKVVSMLQDRMSKITNRYELVLKYGYDTKFASHLLRLLYEGIELMETGKLVFPLKNAAHLLDVKLGKYKVEEVLEMSEKLEDEMRIAKERSSLPIKPNFDKVNELVKLITKSYMHQKYF